MFKFANVDTLIKAVSVSIAVTTVAVITGAKLNVLESNTKRLEKIVDDVSFIRDVVIKIEASDSHQALEIRRNADRIDKLISKE